MNARRVASIAREMGALWLELADALEQEAPPKRRKARAIAPPAVEPSQAALDSARRALRKVGLKT